MAYLKSLSNRLKLLTALWLLAALLSISFTLLLSWRLEGGAAAINDAGSLRKQAYYLQLLIQGRADAAEIETRLTEFDRVLEVLEAGDPTRPLFLPDDARVRQHLSDLQQTWQHEMRPKFQTAAGAGGSAGLAETDRFVERINQLTGTVEAVNSRYINWLRLFQLGLMGMVLISSLIMVWWFYSWIIRPLKKLQTAVSDVHNGRFGVQVPVSTLTEFAQVDNGFNQMSVHLQTLYAGLEQQVNEKTRDLAQQNFNLQTLYFMSHFLNQAQTVGEAGGKFLGKILSMIPAQAGSIRLIDFKRRRLDLVAHQGLPEMLQSAEACRKIDDCLCGHAVQADQWQPIRFHARSGASGDEAADAQAMCRHLGFHFLRVFKIRYKDQELGMMTLYFREEYDFSKWSDLIESVCHQLGSAVNNIRLAEESRQLAVMQERNLMAQGLHDSIAQTLTFLNLQIQMLESALKAGEQAQVAENLQFIKEGVQECYEDVRELLLNFRTKISKKEFAEAVETLTQRFEQQTHIPVNIAWCGNGFPLSSEQQLQFIFILQESLSNIRKHAQAQHVEITLENNDDYTMTIRDDGRGFDTERQLSGRHVGLGIMRERAGRIRAVFRIVSDSAAGGTTVCLTLPKAERILE
ncbi:type IV pili methyl-accepting chemotaxis transducer N-terminal domain-containing protein [Neisseria leonii]|uniref:Sensor protein n=1 Tax=Neisseria leonii TaxID=2995413 RepID=A0A9X4IAD1_9NEIS|nr:type IV pili methyl-accepting chemotaxis transducer N-terminal domain-containing protein [Neisseria sp. 51.81]MDD9327249.1 type IV pili methyl-accepting chemotaxis transducer N-terminal domain-containing protein [Neisseria sp. 51.81]